MKTQTFDIESLEARSREFDRRIGERNRWEYIAGGLGALMTGGIGVIQLVGFDGDLASLFSGLGFVLLAIGAIYAMMQLRSRAGGSPPLDGRYPAMTAYRAELVRQREALSAVLGWYVAPFVPGFVLIYGAAAFEPGARLGLVLLPAAVTLAFLVWVVWINRRAARGLDAEIAAIDRDTTSQRL